MLRHRLKSPRPRTMLQELSQPSFHIEKDSPFTRSSGKVGTGGPRMCVVACMICSRAAQSRGSASIFAFARLRRLARAAHLLERGVEGAVPNVVEQRRVEELRLLRHDAHAAVHGVHLTTAEGRRAVAATRAPSALGPEGGEPAGGDFEPAAPACSSRRSRPPSVTRPSTGS